AALDPASHPGIAFAALSGRARGSWRWPRAGGVLVGTLSRQEIHRGLQLRELETSLHAGAAAGRRGGAAG
ncbi:MAG TPA: hypothetical protein VLS93_00455, partial [Anaeromyxobacteraceae bacterium]|nr:hypothetical protein [Anaeromyxobacteraceae bacterium]